MTPEFSEKETDRKRHPGHSKHPTKGKAEGYCLDEQIGYLLRLANQRHLEIFNGIMPELTPTQFAALARLQQLGPLSQNELGRQAGMDIATTNGVDDRLLKKNLIRSATDQRDKRRLRISLTAKGRRVINESTDYASQITRETLAGLTSGESSQLVNLLLKLQRPPARAR